MKITFNILFMCPTGQMLFHYHQQMIVFMYRSPSVSAAVMKVYLLITDRLAVGLSEQLLIAGRRAGVNLPY